MPKKISKPTKVEPVTRKAVVKTAVRNSPIPKPKAKAIATKMIKEVTVDQIAVRAYEIHISGSGGSELDNWCQAERELRGTV